MATTKDDELDQVRLVELIRSITTDQPTFYLDVPSLLTLCTLEYEWRGKTMPEEGDVAAVLAYQTDAQRLEYEARAKRAFSAAVMAGQVGVMNTGRVGLHDCRDSLPPKSLAH
jgi:hypothetical protein